MKYKPEDPLDAARGIVFSCAVGLLFFILLGFALKLVKISFLFGWSLA